MMYMEKLSKKFAAVGLAALLAAAAAGCTGTGDFDADKTINVVSRESGSGTRGAFIELMGIEVKDADGNKVDKTTEEAIIANQTSVVIATVSSDLYSIGYISLGSMSDSVKPLMIDGVRPSAENVKNGSYKVSRPFNIATNGEPSAAAQDFINFILSSDGQTVATDNGYISVDENAAPFESEMPSGKIVVSGSSSVTPVMEKLKEAYNKINPSLSIEVQMSDSTSGMQDAIDGISDIGMASRELKDSEKAELTEITIALDGIAVVVNPENPIDGLSSEAVRKIYTGEAALWSEVEDE